MTLPKKTYPRRKVVALTSPRYGRVVLTLSCGHEETRWNIYDLRTAPKTTTCVRCPPNAASETRRNPASQQDGG